MKLNDVKNMKRAAEMPIGTQEVTFKKLQYRTDADDEITGVFVHVEEYRSLYIPFFNEDNFQLDLLLGQLGCDSYDPDEINKCAGKKITATRYMAQNMYTNTSFNPNYSGEDAVTLA